MCRGRTDSGLGGGVLEFWVWGEGTGGDPKFIMTYIDCQAKAESVMAGIIAEVGDV